MDEEGTTTTQEAAAGIAATHAAPAERYQGPLAVAAVACGIMLPDTAADTAREGCPQHYCTMGVFLPAGGEDADEYTATAAAAAAAGGVAISAAELEAHYLQARQAVVNTDR
jgi:hypothetical protein